MKKGLRNLSRIDYKKLHKTGVKMVKENESENKEESGKMDNIDSQKIMRYKLLQEEITDYMDENPTNSTLVHIKDIDTCIDEITRLRSQFRAIYIEFSSTLETQVYEDEFSEDVNNILAAIKEYIINAKDRKSVLRLEEQENSQAEVTLKQQKEEEINNKKVRTTEFLLSEVKRLITELNTEFSKESDGEVEDEEILRRKEDLPTTLGKMDQLSSKFQQFLETIPTDFTNSANVIAETKKQYDNLLKEKDRYENFIQHELCEREIEKGKSFQVSSLNIKLEKFSGYHSDMDIYTFQREFEKLHTKCTPKKMLSDLLKYNYLSNPALAMVKSVQNIDDIWERLKKAYGDTKTLLSHKLQAVQDIGPLWKIKSGDQLKNGLLSLINGMTDLISLAEYHDLEGKLYYGDGLDIIYGLMGDRRVTKWLSKIHDTDLEEKELWQELILFLDKELKIQQELSLIKQKNISSKSASSHYVEQELLDPSSNADSIEQNLDSDPISMNPSKSLIAVKGGAISNTPSDGKKSKTTNICHICNETDHIPSGNQGLVQYFSCRKFVSMSPLERFRDLHKKGLCWMCLYPGAEQNAGRHKNGLCQSDYTCKHPSHDRFSRKKHVLVCHEHRDTEENKTLLEEYKNRFILHRNDLEDFSKSIKLSLMTQNSYPTDIKLDKNSSEEEVINENGLYMIHKIKVDEQEYNVFFDSGCSDMVIRYEAVKRLGNRATQELKGPISIGGVGNLKMSSQYGVYKISLPLNNGKEAILAGVCMDQITNTFPLYPIHGNVKDDLLKAYQGSVADFPELPKYVGGDIDIMIGSKYLRYHPSPIFSLTSGLTLFKSVFPGVEGNGVVSGPHPTFTETDRKHNKGKNCQYVYVNDIQLNECLDQTESYHSADLKHENLEMNSHHSFLENLQAFEDAENAGTDINYRCVNCRNCKKCLQGNNIQFGSIKEEIEQDIINKSISINEETGRVEANLPFIENPKSNLCPNKSKALGVFNSQLKQLERDEERRKEVINAEAKLQSLGFVDYVRNLTLEQQTKLRDSQVKNFIPWSAVWKETSISTPCRLVFNASFPTESQKSLNDLLAKGKNNMNSLLDIFLRWRTHLHAYHTDVMKMYNSVLLNENHWCFQRYIWQEHLDRKCIPEEKIIKTLIYGIKSSGNQAITAIRMIVDKYKEEYPYISEIINKDVYVDDCLSGGTSESLSYERADELTLILLRGGFQLKGFTFSGNDPPKALSEDGINVNVAGMKWESKSDLLKFDVGPLNFSKRVRGKKLNDEEFPVCLTRRHCVSKVAEIFDLSGMLTPITASMKIDLHELVVRKLDWDDKIPNDLLPQWKSNFEMIQELPNIKFKRAVIPEDAVGIDMDTIECGDASKEMICIAIYVRFMRKTGKYSCSLLFSRSKLVPQGMTIPRAELFAANLNAQTGKVISHSLGKYHKGTVKLTDSQITLHWLNNKELPLKQWVRNKVIDTLRYSNKEQWYYVKSQDMPADIGTRKGSTIEDITENSVWKNGFLWMQNKSNEFPLKTYNEMKQECKNASDEANEYVKCHTSHITYKLEEVAKRYEFSNYIIDPNKYSFEKVIRVLAMVYKFLDNCKNTCVKVQSAAVTLNDYEIQKAMCYYFRKATQEVKQFQEKRSYEMISTEKDEILYYSGRILGTQSITCTTEMSKVMTDLCETTFCVPLVEKYSPIAASIVDEVHWNHEIAKHSGNETVLRYTMKYAYIIGGRDIVKTIRKTCERCNFLQKRMLEVQMGPVSDHQLRIAPPFYVSQVDIAGPFKAYSPHNKRNTLKIWLVVFCCVVTSTTNVKVMKDYSTPSFIQAFIRLSCDVGYPKVLLIDEGSQLKKGCESMLISFRDTKMRLNRDFHVEFDTCPVGGHYFHGKVERKIRSIRESLEKCMNSERLSILQWETLAAQVANSLNNMPIALTNSVSDLENADIITPNRLKLGRNNERSPIGELNVTSDPSKIISQNNSIFVAWFEAWVISYVPKLIEQPKWFSNDKDLKVGDVVLFLKNEKEICNDYQYGMIAKIENSKDGKARTVKVKYRNCNENVDRFTTRPTRQLVMIHPVDELNIIQELNKISRTVEAKRGTNCRPGV